jgi:hypothetical protein
LDIGRVFVDRLDDADAVLRVADVLTNVQGFSFHD